MKSIKSLLKRLFPRLSLYIKAYQKLIKASSNSYLYSTGWIRSLQEGKPVDRFGSPLPWMNYPVVSFLKERITTDHSMFEFGSGYSTLFYANLCKSIISVEHDEKWLGEIKPELPENSKIILCPKDQDGEYCRSAMKVSRMSEAPFDLIVIDGADRTNCMKQSMQALSSRGVFILDDTDGKTFSECKIIAEKEGFRYINFQGLKPTGKHNESTAIFYRDNNALGI